MSEAALVQLGEFSVAALGGAQASLLGVPQATKLGGFEEATRKLDLAYEVAGERLAASVVVKAAKEVEIKVLQRLGSEGLRAIPQSLGSIEVDGTQYLLMPFYDGRVLDFGDVVPRPVLSMLARIHTDFEQGYQDLDYLPVTDEAYLSRLIGTAAKRVRGFSRATQIMKDVERLADRLCSTLLEFPMTLLQGDVHPGNIIELPDDAVLVDWGNARIGPRAIDLANISSVDGDAWTFYLAESERLGTRMGPGRMRRNHIWASAVINLTYLPAGAQGGGEARAEQMATAVLRSIREL